MPDQKRPVILFDQDGHTYRFASEADVLPHRVSARTFSGIAAQRSSAAETPSPASDDPEAEVSGRHLGADSEFYHTSWEWGRLWFDGQDNLKGEFLCKHRHFSHVDARAYYDPAEEIIPAPEDDDSEVSAHEDLRAR
jgi:hypothetical protein